ncbi:hypothetical protein P8825_14610 [Shouchella clausii]|uniref:hypothetical protein n=1 Tax=Shouchella clausii TaxID=79880 RepID=UPI002DBCBC9E|nr:hypothetical protein [Shouchella clausii]MEB5480796.1 hypothetical protein [Shouchella clausii]
MANQAFIEIATKVASKTAKREEKKEFVEAIKEIATDESLGPNRYWKINQIITRTANELFKPRVDFYEYIADVERVGRGEKLQFDIPMRTGVAMAWTGRGTTVDYERMQGSQKLDVEPEVIAGGVYYEMDQLATGDVDGFVGAVDSLVDSLDSNVNARVMSTLHRAMAHAPRNNRWQGAGIQKANFDKLSSIVTRYGKRPVALVDYDLGVKLTELVPQAGQTEAMKEKINSDRILGRVSGVDIVTFTNPFAIDDTENEKYAVPRNYGYIFPTGYDKPIKIGFEGDLTEYTAQDIQSERVFLKVKQLVGVRALTDLRNVCEINDTTLV